MVKHVTMFCLDCILLMITLIQVQLNLNKQVLIVNLTMDKNVKYIMGRIVI